MGETEGVGRGEEAGGKGYCILVMAQTEAAAADREREVEIKKEQQCIVRESTAGFQRR